MDSRDDRYLTLDEVAAYLHLDVGTIRRMVQRGELRAVQMGRESHRPLRVRVSDIEEALAGWVNR
jgi:excisionase family DNA binding protein